MAEAEQVEEAYNDGKAQPFLQETHKQKNMFKTPIQIQEQLEYTKPGSLLKNKALLTSNKLNASISKDRVNESTTIASQMLQQNCLDTQHNNARSMQMDTQAYKQQLLRTLQDQQVKKIDYFTIRKEEELYKSSEMEPTPSYNQFANQSHMLDHLIKDGADNRQEQGLESPSKGREPSRRQEITFDKSAECSIDSS